MSDTTETTTPTKTNEGAEAETETPAWDDVFRGEDPAKVRKQLDHAREWERRAKENADAAKRLKEIEDAQKSEAEKAAERIRELESKASAAQRDALRFKVAAKYQISDEDAELFLTGDDEQTLTRQAERLAGKSDEQKKHGNYAPREGGNPKREAGTSDEREFARNLFGGGS